MIDLEIRKKLWLFKIVRWLKKPRWGTLDNTRAEKSIFQWGANEDSYTLSLLGVINGILPLMTRYVLVVVIEDFELRSCTIDKKEKMSIEGIPKKVSLQFKKKWW